MNIQKISPKLLIFLLLAFFCAVALIIRIVPPYDHVFSGGWIKFTTNDAYFQMRIVDYLTYNFPKSSQMDPYFSFPGIIGFGNLHFFNLLIAGVAWIFSLGKYNQHIVDLVGVYFPPVLAALTTIPVYFLGKELFGKWAGVLAAALIAVMPGEFLVRSILGSTDQHVAEILFSTVSVLFLMLAINEANKKQLDLNQFTKEKWELLARPLIYSCLGGLFLVMYLASWQGAMLFTLIISIYLVVQFLLDFFQGQSSTYLGITGFVFFLIAAIFFYPTALTYSARLVLVTAAILPLFFMGLSVLFTRTKLNRGFYPLLLVIGASAYFGVIYMLHSSSIQYLARQSALVFFPQGFGASTTSEMQPFLSVLGSFSTQVAWENFTTSFFLVRPWPIPGLGIISFIVLIWLFIKNRGRQKLHLFLIIWTLVMAAATLVQRRFAYYLSINIALLSGYLAWQFIWLGGMRNLVSGINNKVEKLRDKTAREKRKKRRESQSIAVHYLRVAVVSVVVFVLFFLFNILTVKQEASVTPLAPSDAWEEALTWMKENTPEPLGASTEYFKYQSYDYVYPPSIYSVTSWWDYGYWITRIGHRIPIVNPSQNAYLVSKVANAFVSRSELEADTITESLRSRYLICDTAMVTSKFWGIVTWTGREKEEFYEDYYVNQNGKLVAATVFYPEYFESVLVRLYNFDGKAVTTIEPTVITFIEKIGQDGKPFKQITGAQKFNTYKEAMAFIAEAGPANHRLVSMSPFTSPVALSRILNYRLVFSSKETNNTVVPGMAIPQVKIYQYLGN